MALVTILCLVAVLVIILVAMGIGAWRSGKKRDADRRAAAKRFYTNRAGVYTDERTLRR